MGNDKKSEMFIPEDIMIEARSLAQRYDLVGGMYAKAVERGEFDNLEGAGKPLDLEENPYEPTDVRMLHKVLKDNGFAPYWIELKKEIDDLTAKLNKEVDFFTQYIRVVYSEQPSRRTIRYFEKRKEYFFDQSRKRLVEISKKILDYNLHCPVSNLNRSNIDVDDEMSKLIENTEKIIEDLKGSFSRL